MDRAATTMGAPNQGATMFYRDDSGALAHPSPMPDEAICPVCGERIRWVVDMFSFTTAADGCHKLAHARCVWTKPAFRRQERDAPDD
jgi:hypothetical protein